MQGCRGAALFINVNGIYSPMQAGGTARDFVWFDLV